MRKSAVTRLLFALASGGVQALHGPEWYFLKQRSFIVIIVPRQIYVGESYRDISTEGEVGDKQEFLHFVYLVLLKIFHLDQKDLQDVM